MPKAAEGMSTPIPVLLMARELGGVGGIERDVSKFARHLSQYGIAPHVACFNPGGVRWCEIESAGVPVLPVPVTSFKSRSAIAGAKILRQYIRDHRIQVVHTFDPGANVFGGLLAGVLGAPVTLSSQLCFRELYPLQMRLLLAVVDRLVTGLFVNCHALAEHLISHSKVPSRRIHVCHNGFEAQEFHPNGRTRPPQLADASVVIGTVAALREEKNLASLVEAFAEVRKVEHGAHLLIVGSGPMKPTLEQRALDLKIAAACTFEAATNAPARWMRAIDVFVVPSRSEAFPNALLEAMACGCCPVGARVGGIPELIKDGERGNLFDSGNVRQLGVWLCELATNSARRQQMARAASAFVHEHFTIDIAASRLAGIYKQLLAERVGSRLLASPSRRSVLSREGDLSTSTEVKGNAR